MAAANLTVPILKQNAPGLIQINAPLRFARHKARMDTEIAILDDAETPLCPSCGQPMRFVGAVPRFAALPELHTYECRACGETYTEAVEPGDRADLAWTERRRNDGTA